MSSGWHMIRLVALAIAASMSFSALGGEEVLWWQVGVEGDSDSLADVQITTFHEGVKTAAELGVTDARIRVVGTDDYLPMLKSDDYDYDDVMPVPTDWQACLISPYASEAYSFVIELGNWDYDNGTWTMIATSEAASYTDLKNPARPSIWDPDDIAQPDYQAWQPTSYVIPEPSGGLLMLMGFALLALRRRNAGG